MALKCRKALASRQKSLRIDPLRMLLHGFPKEEVLLAPQGGCSLVSRIKNNQSPVSLSKRQDV